MSMVVGRCGQWIKTKEERDRDAAQWLARLIPPSPAQLLLALDPGGQVCPDCGDTGNVDCPTCEGFADEGCKGCDGEGIVTCHCEGGPEELDEADEADDEEDQ